MPDKSELERRVRVGQQAATLMESELFRECMKTLRDDAIADFAGADPSDVQALQTARLKYAVIEEFVNKFHAKTQDGQMAAHNMPE